jgi:hypothetical protein
MLAAPLAVLLQLNAVLQCLLILERVVIRTLAYGAFEFDEIILRHGREWDSDETSYRLLGTRRPWSHPSDLNRRPTVYKTVALPLS